MFDSSILSVWGMTENSNKKKMVTEETKAAI